jgi:hypothetical protein
VGSEEESPAWIERLFGRGRLRKGEPQSGAGKIVRVHHDSGLRTAIPDFIGDLANERELMIEVSRTTLMPLAGDRIFSGSKRARHPHNDRVSAVFGHCIQDLAPHLQPERRHAHEAQVIAAMLEHRGSWGGGLGGRCHSAGNE